MKYISICFALAFAFQVKAAEIKLATINSDTTTDTTVFFLETNPTGEAKAMRYVTTAESGRILEDVHSTVEEVLAEGVLVKEMEGREIIRLFIEKFNVTNGGDVRLYTLSSGVTGSYSNYYLKLTKVNNEFVLTDTKGQTINTIFVAGRWSRILRRWVGVSDIRTSFDKKNL